ncbi:GTPase domain-containing protein [Candidatus Nasuia deltocephalinicola]|uniref:GTPase domain-containing protein n=1 Tax=Candidatus Nasuia deltocephalincola TaxID=1160784 RepID=UPI00216B0A06|nr:GTPase domain-containing protein [Candidatus Nasuia deltocephalinicola]
MFFKFLEFLKLHINPGKGGDGGKIFLKKKKILKKKLGKGGDGGKIYFFFDKFLGNDFSYYLNRKKIFSEKGKNSSKLLKNGKNGKNIIIRIPYKCKIFNIKNNNFVNFKNKKVLNLILEGGKGLKGCVNKYKKNKKSKIIFNNNFKIYESYYLLNNYFFNICLIGSTNTGKTSFISNLLKLNLKISNYCYTTLNKKIFYLKLFNKKISLIDNPGFLKINNIFNILKFNNIYFLSKIFFQFIDIFFIFNLIFNFKLFNNKIYINNKFMFYKPRFLVFNKIDLILKFKNITIFKLKKFFNWYNFIFFNGFNFKNNCIFKKIFFNYKLKA